MNRGHDADAHEPYLMFDLTIFASGTRYDINWRRMVYPARNRGDHPAGYPALHLNPDGGATQ